MQKNILTASIIGLVIGILGTVSFSAITNMNNPANVMSNSQTSTSTYDHNKQMTDKLKNLIGDNFDKAFIEEMIMHHQGAIDMADLTAKNANHDEIKKLGQDIIAAQNKEISDMKMWQTDWGYIKSTDNNMHTRH